MSKTKLINNVTRTVNKAGIVLKKHSPEILAAVGVAGTVVSAVMACKATLKVNEVVEETKETINKIHEATENGVTVAGENYTVEDSKKDLTLVYAQTGVKLAKMYGPAVIIGSLSIGAMLTSNNILRKRNVALTAAYATLDKSFKEYRGRVVERFGKELDRELRFNIKAQEVEERVVDENGNEQTVTKTVRAVDPNHISDYAKIWYEGNPGWSKDPEFNLMYLKRQQDYANDKLKAKGYLFLNDVYEQLGFPKTAAGQIVGWVYNEENPVGDNFVDFGIYDQPEFVNGYERSVLLDFNVDGNILDLI